MARPAGKPVRRRRHADPVRPRAWPGGGPARQPGRHRGAAPAPFDDAKSGGGGKEGQHAVPQAGSSTRNGSSRRSATSARATHSRSSSPSAPSGRRRPLPSTSTGHSDASTVALPLPAGAGRTRTVGSSPETLVKAEDNGIAERTDRRTTHPGEGDAERLLQSRRTERARDASSTSAATTSPASRSRVPSRPAVPRAGALLAPRISCPR